MACMAENNGCACMPSSNAFIPYNSATSNVYYSGLLSPQPPPLLDGNRFHHGAFDYNDGVRSRLLSSLLGGKLSIRS